MDDIKARIKVNIYKELLQEEKKKRMRHAKVTTSALVLTLFISFQGEYKIIPGSEEQVVVQLNEIPNINWSTYFEEEVAAKDNSIQVDELYSDEGLYSSSLNF